MREYIETINDVEFRHIVPTEGGVLRCIETGGIYNYVYLPSFKTDTFEEIPDESEISDDEALKIILGKYEEK